MGHSRAYKPTVLVYAVIATVLIETVNADMCKWVDENGTVHYAETCPEYTDSTKIEIQALPSQEQVVEADKRYEEFKKIISKHDSSKASEPSIHEHKGRSLPLEELGSLPENTTSTYLITKGAYISLDFEKNDKGQFYLNLKARDNLPGGAYLEAHFPKPANADQKQIVGKKLRREGSEILMHSPKSSGFKCWNYEVEVFVYRDDSKDDLLDVHRQIIQSKFDQSLVKDVFDFSSRMSKGGICPSIHQEDIKKMSVKQLDALCEREREKHLKPERDKLIKRCIKRGEKQAEWCENYYADWGDAQRIDTATIRRALYYNLPECVAAKEAREKVTDVR